MEKGYVQVYTGNGKGKTTAAIGLAVRAAGAGRRVYFMQFVKGRLYSEIEALKKLSPLITVHQCGLGRFIKGEPSNEDRAKASRGFAECTKTLREGTYDIVVLDEANVAVSLGLVSIKELLQAIGQKNRATEVVITGRNAHPDLIAHADLVSEIHEVKHYFSNGVGARTGIEK